MKMSELIEQTQADRRAYIEATSTERLIANRGVMVASLKRLKCALAAIGAVTYQRHAWSVDLLGDIRCIPVGFDASEVEVPEEPT